MCSELQSFPQISVVIPTRDRKDVLVRVLDGLNAQTCDAKLFEIIIVDDGSEDGTQKAVKEFSLISKAAIKYVHQAKLGPGAARNAGVDRASGRWILFLDTDLIPEADVVQRHLVFHQESDDDFKCLLGGVEMAPELNIREQARQNETEMLNYGQGLQEVSHWHFRTGNASLSKNLCAVPSGFDPRFEAAEDTEFAYRLRAMDVSFFYDGAIKVYHYHPMNKEEFFEKYAAYGRSVALWFFECPQARRELALRYGVFAAELPIHRKVKYALRTIFVNRQTIAFLSWIAKHLKAVYSPISQSMDRNVVQYYCRKAFRARLFSLMQMQIINSS